MPPRPTPEQEQLLLVSPEARAARQAERLAERPIKIYTVSRGRKRPELFPIDGLQLEYPEYTEALPLERIERLDRYLQTNGPLFDQFTRGYQVKPDRDSIELYCMGSNKRNKRVPSDEITREEINANKRRQTQNVADKLQKEANTNFMFAYWRRNCLRATSRYLRGSSDGLDEWAILGAADAIEDFGHGLLENRKLEDDKIIDILQIEGMAEHLIYIGQFAPKNFALFTYNPNVLRLVQREQARRQEYWERLFIATRVLRDRLTRSEKEDIFELQFQIAKMMSVS